MGSRSCYEVLVRSSLQPDLRDGGFIPAPTFSCSTAWARSSADMKTVRLSEAVILTEVGEQPAVSAAWEDGGQMRDHRRNPRDLLPRQKKSKSRNINSRLGHSTTSLTRQVPQPGNRRYRTQSGRPRAAWARMDRHTLQRWSRREP